MDVWSIVGIAIIVRMVNENDLIHHHDGASSSSVAGTFTIMTSI